MVLSISLPFKLCIYLMYHSANELLCDSLATNLCLYYKMLTYKKHAFMAQIEK